MSKVKTIIEGALEEKPLDVKEAFDELILPKIATVLEAKKEEYSRTILENDEDFDDEDDIEDLDDEIEEDLDDDVEEYEEDEDEDEVEED